MFARAHEIGFNHSNAHKPTYKENEYDQTLLSRQGKKPHKWLERANTHIATIGVLKAIVCFSHGHSSYYQELSLKG